MEKETVQDLAKEYLAYFEVGQRENGESYILTDPTRSVPEELRELIYDAHAGMMPDDWKYEFIWEALQLIAEAEDLDNPEIEPDIYNNRLLAWLGSNIQRGGYVYVKRVGLDPCVDFDIYALARQGELVEREEVYQSVLMSLREAEHAGEKVE